MSWRLRQNRLTLQAAAAERRRLRKVQLISVDDDRQELAHRIREQAKREPPSPRMPCAAWLMQQETAKVPQARHV